MFRLAALSTTVLLALVSLARADGLIIVDDPPNLPDDSVRHSFAPLTIKRHKVSVDIKKQVARTRVDQVFYNPHGRRLEGTYLFPVPEGAHVDEFSMEIDGEVKQAELLSAEEAREIYEEILREQKDPALMEYAGRKAFKVRIFPIEPHSRKRIRLEYTQVLRADHGLVEYRYPLNTERFSAEPIKRVAMKVDLRATAPLKTIYSPTHEVDVQRKGKKRAVVGFETKDARPDKDFKLFYGKAEEEIAMNLLTHRPESGPGYFLLLASPGERTGKEEVAKKDVVFVLDTSGSMEGKKLAQAKDALRYCVGRLNKGDRFQVMRFSTGVEALLDGLVPATKANRKKAKKGIGRFEGRGGTAIHSALDRSLSLAAGQEEDRPCFVVFLTDGKPTVGTTDEDKIVEMVKRRTEKKTIRTFSFGIGTDINTHRLDRISKTTRGSTEYVLPDQSIERVVSNFYDRIAYPVLASPELSFSGDARAMKVHPSPLPALFRGEQLVVLGRYRGSGSTAVKIEGTVNEETEKIVEEFSLPAPGDAGEQSFVARLWATRRVGFLLNEIRLHGEKKELKDEVVRLAKEYGIVTPYTSYLVAEDEALARRRDGDDRGFRFQSTRSLDEAARRVPRAQGGGGGGLSSSSGEQAVRAARSTKALESAQQVGASERASRIARGKRSGRSQADARRVVKGKTFYRRDKTWVDAKALALDDPRKVEVTLGSEEYLALFQKHPNAADWLSVGKRVKVVIDGVLYVVTG